MRCWLEYGFFSLVLAAMVPMAVQAQDRCGSLLPETARHQDRQDDYLDPHPAARRHLKLVADHHFRPQIRRFDGHPMYIMENLDYTLLHFPNYHEALYAVSQFERRNGGRLPQKAGWRWRRSAECYFVRAIRFRPEDGVVRMLYGIHLHKGGKLEQALEQYKTGLELIPRSSELNYNLGLLYYDLKKYELAKKYATTAYELGYPLPGLKKLLEKVGHWP
ncbi:TPR repeat-containing protein [Nitrosococcus halophilus Nc 4]|uniref:TPR repeat-containing protein n=1 Tax=Nitrosococcus halophilus (strain Nc4) TaxID=472759 RepID=D5C026_NITHN|nr:tetratricopeptide repeat protein [Nitrosococcus halophilus]ADE16273.1 TPR repeat-containing protein [Nitrosococcus halophilus Nc 4]